MARLVNPNRRRVRNRVQLVTPGESVADRYARLQREREEREMLEATEQAHEAERIMFAPAHFRKKTAAPPPTSPPSDTDEEPDRIDDGRLVQRRDIPKDGENAEFDRDVKTAVGRLVQMQGDNRKNRQQQDVLNLATKYKVDRQELNRLLNQRITAVEEKTADIRRQVEEEARDVDVPQDVIDAAVESRNPYIVKEWLDRQKEEADAKLAEEKAQEDRTADERAREVVESFTPEERAELERAGLADETYDVAREILSLGGTVTGADLVRTVRQYNEIIDAAHRDAQPQPEEVEEGFAGVSRADIEKSFMEAGISPAEFVRRTYAAQPDLAYQAWDVGTGFVPFLGTAQDIQSGAPGWAIGLGAATDVLPIPGAAGVGTSVARRGAARYGPDAFSRAPTYRATLQALGFTHPFVHPREMAKGAVDVATAPYRAGRGAFDPAYFPTGTLFDTEATVRIPLDVIKEKGLPSYSLLGAVDEFEKSLTPQGVEWLRAQPAMQKLRAGEELTPAEQRTLAPPSRFFFGAEDMPKALRDFYEKRGLSIQRDLQAKPSSLLEQAAYGDVSVGLVMHRAGHPTGTPKIAIGGAGQPRTYIETDVGRAAEFGQTPAYFHASPALELSDPVIQPDLATSEPLFGGAFTSPGSPLPRFITQSAYGAGGERPGAIMFTGQDDRHFLLGSSPKIYRDVIEMEAQVPGGRRSEWLAPEDVQTIQRFLAEQGTDPLTFGASAIPTESRYRFFADAPRGYPEGVSGPRFPTYEMMTRQGTELRTPGAIAALRGTGRTLFGDPWRLRGWREVDETGRTIRRVEDTTPSVAKMDADIEALYETRDRIAQQATEAGGADEFALQQVDNAIQTLTRQRDDRALTERAFAEAQEQGRRTGAAVATARAPLAVSTGMSPEFDERFTLRGGAFPRAFPPVTVPRAPRLTGLGGVPSREFDVPIDPARPDYLFGRDELTDPWDFVTPRITETQRQTGLGGVPLREFDVVPPATPTRPGPIVPRPSCYDDPFQPGCPGEVPVVPVVPVVPPEEEEEVPVVPVEPEDPDREKTCAEDPSQAKCHVPPPPDGPLIPVEDPCKTNPLLPQCDDRPEDPCKTNPNLPECIVRPPPPPNGGNGGGGGGFGGGGRPTIVPMAPTRFAPPILTVTARREAPPTTRDETRIQMPTSQRVFTPPPPTRRTGGGEAGIVATGGRAELAPTQRAQTAIRRIADIRRAPTTATRRGTTPRLPAPPVSPPSLPSPRIRRRSTDDMPRRTAGLYPRLVDFQHGYDVHTVDLATGAHRVTQSPRYSIESPSRTFRVVTTSNATPREHVIDIPGPREFVVSAGGVGHRADTPTAAINRRHRARVAG